MNCVKCGYEIEATACFCPQCGQKQDEKRTEKAIDSDTTHVGNNKNLLAYYISVLTSPLILIFRLVAQTTESYKVSNWGKAMTRERTYLSDEMKVVLFVLLAISTFLVISLKKNSPPISKGKSAATVFLLFFNILFGIAAALIV